MKAIQKEGSVILMLTILFITTGCPEFERGFKRPACIYEDRSLEVYVSDYELYNDSVINVSFEPVEKLEWPLWLGLNRYELESFSFDCDLEKVKDTSIIYFIEGSFITQGSCSPTMISSVKLVD